MMMVTQFEFVLCLATNSPVVISIPHEGFYQGDLEPYFYPRKHGVRGREQYLCAIASDANRKIPVASIVRGLLPRSLCDYNRPIHAAPKNRAVADKKLVTFYESYHTCVWELLDQAARRYGKCYHLDLHGFDPERSGLAYDLVLGSHNGRTTLREIDEKALYFLKMRGTKPNSRRLEKSSPADIVLLNGWTEELMPCSWKYLPDSEKWTARMKERSLHKTCASSFCLCTNKKAAQVERLFLMKNNYFTSTPMLRAEPEIILIASSIS